MLEPEVDENVEQQDEGGNSEMHRTHGTDLVDTVLSSVATPTAVQTQFATLDSNEPVTPIVGEDADSEGVADAAESVNKASLYAALINKGNFLQMAVSLNSGRASHTLAQLTTSILSIASSVQFHQSRMPILKPFSKGSAPNIEQLIANSKQICLQLPGAPRNCDPDTISWDALSYKIAPSASELFCYKYPAGVQHLGAQDFRLLDEAEATCLNVISQKCAEYRATSGVPADETVPDVSKFLENSIKGSPDPGRCEKIAKIGEAMLLKYVDSMQAVFATGNLPSAPQPVKVYACHDVLTAATLRASIAKLAESQIMQQATLLGNQNAISRAFNIPASEQWGVQQNASITLQANTDNSMRRAMKTMGEDYDRPMGQLQNQLGGAVSNGLKEQVAFRSNGAVVTLSLEEKEIAKQQVSLLLACLRIRANATQLTPWELMSADDLDHFEIVKFLSRGSSPMALAMNGVMGMAQTIAQSYETGHNMVKFGKDQLSQELCDQIRFTMEGRVKQLLSQVALFSADSAEGNQLMGLFMKCTMISLATQQRVILEIRARSGQVGADGINEQLEQQQQQ